MKITPSTAARPKPLPSAAEFIGLGGKASSIDVFLDSADYKNIDERNAAKMLGHFTQGMQAQGFPWRLKVASKEGLQGKLHGTQELSDLDALRRLQKGEAVIFQPMRNLRLDLSSDSLGALAAAGTAAGTDVASMNKLATVSKNTKVTAGNQGFELRFGEPVEVKNLAELKLLHQMYNPAVKPDSKNPVAQAAHQLSYFNQQEGDYGWRFYQQDEGGATARVSKAFYKNALRGAAMGAAVGAMIGAPIGLFTQSLNTFLAATGIAAGGFALYGGVDGARTAAKGKPLNTVEALQSILNEEPVQVQETQMRSVGVPILGKVSWFSDRGKSSTVSNGAELDTMFYLQNQAAKIEQPAKPEPPKPPTTIIIDQSKHYYGNLGLR